MSKATSFSFLVLFMLFWSCTPPMFISPEAEATPPEGWENTGNINASFLSTSRSIGIPTNTGSPSFEVTYIASASNIDSLHWSFPGGITNDSISEVNEVVQYNSFGTFDVGLKVFNLEDNDARLYENFVSLYYQDNWTFGSDDQSWTVTGTNASDQDFERPTIDGVESDNWVTVPYTSGHEIIAEKNFSNFPSNNLEIEFFYKMERVRQLYIDNSSRSTSPTVTASNTVYLNPMTATASYTTITTPVTYPGARRFSLLFNGIPVWVASSLTEDRFERVKLSLPSVSNFTLGIKKEQSELYTRKLLYPYDYERSSYTASSTVASPTEDTDGDGLINRRDPCPLQAATDSDPDTDGDGCPDSQDTDDDNDGYYDTTEVATGANPLMANSTPSYYINHLRYPYVIHIRNLTIKVRE